jgi:uncharacterized membrane protein
MKASKNHGIPKFLAFAITVLAMVLSFAVYPLLPGVVPVHWNAAGQADGFGRPWMAAFLMPLIMALVLLLFVLIPKIAVFKKNLKAFEKQYWLLGLVIELFFLLFYAITLFPNFGVETSLSALFSLPLAFLFIAIGLLLPSFRRNFFVGIRTPWTLSSDRVWKKTHEFGGTLFVAAGIVSLGTAFLAPKQSILTIVVVVLAAALATVVYSFLEFRNGFGKKGKPKL